MDEIVGYCGLNCCACPIYVATREKNDDKRRRMRVEIARQIKEHYGTEHKQEDISDCDGCRAKSGSIFCKDCQIRKCAKERDIENCAYCAEYACEQLLKLFATDPDAKKRLDKIRDNC